MTPRGTIVVKESPSVYILRAWTVEMQCLPLLYKFFLYKSKTFLMLSNRWLGCYFYFQQIHRDKSNEVIRKC